MIPSDPSLELMQFPCHLEFKAFGPGGEDSSFFNQVESAVSNVVQVSRQAMKTRPS